MIRLQQNARQPNDRRREAWEAWTLFGKRIRAIGSLGTFFTFLIDLACPHRHGHYTFDPAIVFLGFLSGGTAVYCWKIAKLLTQKEEPLRRG